MRGLITLLVLVAVSAAIFALGSLRKDADGKSVLHVAEELPLTVQVTRPERGEIVRLVQAPGDVEAVLEVEISSEIVSKITEMSVEEGDTVEPGQFLCRLDDRHLLADVESGEARIEQLRAAMAEAEAHFEKADRDYRRQVTLSESNSTSNLEMRDYLTLRKKARAQLDMRSFEMVEAQARLKRVREDLRKTVITSPIAGVISKVNAKQGEVVVTGTMNNPGTVILTITDLSRMQVRARVDEMDIPLVNPGQAGRIYLQADADTPVPAEVVRVASKGTKAVGRDVVTFEALLAVHSHDARVKPGMTANVEIEVARSEDAITVPVEAVVHRKRKDLPEALVSELQKRQGELGAAERVRRGQYIKVLYVVNEGASEVRLIDSGIADTRRVEIREGLDLDDQVVVGPYRSLDQLEDGRKVELEDEDKGEEATEETVAAGDEPGEDPPGDPNEEPAADTSNRDASADAKKKDKESLASSSSP